MAGAVGILLYKLSQSEDEMAQEFVKNIYEYPLAADICVTVLALMIFPSNVTGYVGAAFAGLIASAFFMPEDQNETAVQGKTNTA